MNKSHKYTFYVEMDQNRKTQEYYTQIRITDGSQWGNRTISGKHETLQLIYCIEAAGGNPAKLPIQPNKWGVQTMADAVAWNTTKPSKTGEVIDKTKTKTPELAEVLAKLDPEKLNKLAILLGAL